VLALSRGVRGVRISGRWVGVGAVFWFLVCGWWIGKPNF